MTQAEVDFFISYADEDRPWAEWLAWQLDGAGYRVVLQAWNFRPGTDFLHEMERATSQASRTIAVLSESYTSSRFGEAEWRAVFARDPSGERGLLVPVRVTECRPPALLASRVYIDLVGRDALSARETLLAGLRGRGAKPRSEPPFPPATARGIRPDFPGKRRTRHWELGPAGPPDWEGAPDGAVEIYLGEGDRRVAVRVTDYLTVRELLDDLYVHYLRDAAAPFSYGREWLLVGDGHCIAPVEWVLSPGVSIHKLCRGWQESTTPEEAGVDANPWFFRRSPAEVHCMGLVTDHPELIPFLQQDPKVLEWFQVDIARGLSAPAHGPPYRAAHGGVFLTRSTDHRLTGRVLDVPHDVAQEVVDEFTYPRLSP